MNTPSRQQIKGWASLNFGKRRRETGLLLAEGAKVVAELRHSPWTPTDLLVRADAEERWETLISGGYPVEVPRWRVSVQDWKALSQDKASEGLLAVVRRPESPSIESILSGTGHLLLGYRIANPNNLGALLRTADWFGIQAVLLSRDSVDITSPKVVRTAMGSLFHLPVLEDLDFETLLPALADRTCLIATAPGRGESPHPTGTRTALLLGNESHGLPEILTRCVSRTWRIPGAGRTESLSLPQAAAIFLYEIARPEIPGR